MCYLSGPGDLSTFSILIIPSAVLYKNDLSHLVSLLVMLIVSSVSCSSLYNRIGGVMIL